MMRSDDEINPSGLFPNRGHFRDYVKLEHGLHTRRDPTRQRALREEARRLAASPGEFDALMQTVARLAARGTVIRPADLSAILG